MNRLSLYSHIVAQYNHQHICKTRRKLKLIKSSMKSVIKITHIHIHIKNHPHPRQSFNNYRLAWMFDDLWENWAEKWLTIDNRVIFENWAYCYGLFEVESWGSSYWLSNYQTINNKWPFRKSKYMEHCLVVYGVCTRGLHNGISWKVAIYHWN